MARVDKVLQADSSSSSSNERQTSAEHQYSEVKQEKQSDEDAMSQQSSSSASISPIREQHISQGNHSLATALRLPNSTTAVTTSCVM